MFDLTKELLKLSKDDKASIAGPLVHEVLLLQEQEIERLTHELGMARKALAASKSCSHPGVEADGEMCPDCGWTSADDSPYG